MTTFTVRQSVAAVEHDDSTRQPRKGGMVHRATVTAVDMNAVQVRYDDETIFGGKTDAFWLAGWRAWDGMFRWRLVPLCERADCGKPVVTPVTSPDDPLGRRWCSEDCRDDEAQARYEQHYPSGVTS